MASEAGKQLLSPVSSKDLNRLVDSDPGINEETKLLCQSLFRVFAAPQTAITSAELEIRLSSLLGKRKYTDLVRQSKPFEPPVDAPTLYTTPKDFATAVDRDPDLSPDQRTAIAEALLSLDGDSSVEGSGVFWATISQVVGETKRTQLISHMKPFVPVAPVRRRPGPKPRSKPREIPSTWPTARWSGLHVAITPSDLDTFPPFRFRFATVLEDSLARRADIPEPTKATIRTRARAYFAEQVRQLDAFLVVIKGLIRNSGLADRFIKELMRDNDSLSGFAGFTGPPFGWPTSSEFVRMICAVDGLTEEQKLTISQQFGLVFTTPRELEPDVFWKNVLALVGKEKTDLILRRVKIIVRGTRLHPLPSPRPSPLACNETLPPVDDLPEPAENLDPSGEDLILDFDEEPKAKRLRSADEWVLLEVVRNLREDSTAAPFLKPIDHELYPDYGNYVRREMDLETIEAKIRKGEYSKMRHCRDDILQIWTNCELYNDGFPKRQWLVRAADNLREKTRRLWREADIDKDEQ
jgi:hypothetical protein